MASLNRRGSAAVVMVILLIILNLMVVSLSVGLARDHDLTVRRVQTIEAAYAAEAGVNMSIRELMNGLDEDGNGTVGSISDDSDDATDPTLGRARVVVTLASGGGETTLTSDGRAGLTRRRMEAVLQDPP